MQWSQRMTLTVLVGLAALAGCDSSDGDDRSGEATEVSSATTAPTGSVPSEPPTMFEPLGAFIPALPGIELIPTPNVDWSFYNLPPGSLAWVVGVRSDEGTIGQLTVADNTETPGWVSTYFHTIFSQGVPFVVFTETDDTTPNDTTPDSTASDTTETAADPSSTESTSTESSSTASVETTEPELTSRIANLSPKWEAVGANDVAVATVDAGALRAWIWTHDGRIWILRGAVETGRPYVEQLLAAMGAGSDPYDDRIVSAAVRPRLVDVPGYRYADIPRRDLLSRLPNTLAGACAEAAWLGYVVTEGDPDPETKEPEDPGLLITSVSPLCEEAGFLDELTEALDDQEDASKEQISGVDVYRTPREVIAIDGSVIIHVVADEPSVLENAEPWLEGFFAGQ